MTSNGEITSYGLNNKGENFSITYEIMFQKENSTDIINSKNYTIKYIYKKDKKIPEINIFSFLNESNTKEDSNCNNSNNKNKLKDYNNNSYKKDCKIEFNITSNIFYQNKIIFSFKVKEINKTNNKNKDLTNFTIEYWITNLKNETIKKEIKTKNKNKKIFTPKNNIGIYFINAILYYKNKIYFRKKKVVCYTPEDKIIKNENNNNNISYNHSNIIITKEDNNLKINIYKGNTRKRVVIIYLNNLTITKLYLKKQNNITLVYNINFLRNIYANQRYKEIRIIKKNSSSLNYNYNSNINYSNEKKPLILRINGLGMYREYIFTNLYDSSNYTNFTKDLNNKNNTINFTKINKKKYFYLTNFNLNKNNLSFTLYNNYFGNLSCYILKEKTKISNTFNIYLNNYFSENMSNSTNLPKNILKINLNINISILNKSIKKNNIIPSKKLNMSKDQLKILCKIKIKNKNYYKYTSSYLNITLNEIYGDENKNLKRINNNFTIYTQKMTSQNQSLKIKNLFSSIENPKKEHKDYKMNITNISTKSDSYQFKNQKKLNPIYSKRKSIFDKIGYLTLLSLGILSIFLIIKH